MTWTALRWVWRLEAPLFIGMPPAGALNRCRPYVPARVLWGAVTAEISRSRNGDSFPDYGKLGWETALNCRFTYLYPSEKRGDKFLAWMPKYERARGVQWCCHGEEERPSDRDFRRRLLDSRPGTAIAPETDSASEGTLRETECINPWWRDSNCHGETNAMLLLGYIFLRNNGFRRQLDNIDILFVGGDTRYGLGKICRVGWHELSCDLSVFGRAVDMDKENPEIQSDIVWGHALEGGQPHIQGMQGVKELLGGWDQGSPWRGALAWAPGSFLEKPTNWCIDNYRSVIYLVPFRAMVGEKYRDFDAAMGRDSVGWEIFPSSSDYQEYDSLLSRGRYKLAIVVYEKLFALGLVIFHLLLIWPRNLTKVG